MRITKTMYNIEQKQRYLDYEEENIQTITTYFKRLSDKEEELDKDLLEMNVDEIKSAILSINVRGEETRGQLISLLKRYALWGISNNVISDCGILKVSTESTFPQKAIELQMIKNPKQLSEILDSTLDFVNYENRSKMISLAFKLLYCGIKIKDIYKLKKDDLNEETKIISFDTERFEVYDDIVSLWKHCKDMKHIEKRNSGTRGNEYAEAELVNSKLLFREEERKRRDNKTSFLEAFISNVIRDYSKLKGEKYSLPSRNIRMSGLFYKLLCLEKEGLTITNTTIAECFNMKYEDKTELNSKTRGLKIDYDNWKIAFKYV